PYEDYLRVAKPGVHQQLEFEHGGPYTPSPKPASVNRRSQSNNHRSSDVGESAAVRAKTARDSSAGEADDKTEKSAPPAEVPTTRAVTTSGFTAVNSNPGGFSAINASPSFVAVNSGPTVKREMENGISTPGQASENRVSS